MKTITIIDAFIRNPDQEKSLVSFIDRIKETGPIFLVSNSKISNTVLDRVDYFFYDKNDNLYRNEYEGYEKYYHWRKIGGIKLITVEEHKQKHGLSVMINLTMVLNICKDLGFTHFRRLEYDTVLGDKTLHHISSMPDKCLDLGKDCYFFIDDEVKSVAYQYFFSDILFFISNFPNIRKESDYIEILREEFGNENFVIVEKLMYHFLKKCDPDGLHSLKFKDDEIFSDSIWNTSSSATHFGDHPQDCYINIYRNSDKFLCFSINNSFEKIYRKIVFTFKDGKKQSLEYNFNPNGNWFINDVEEEPIMMEIFDESSLIFSKNIDSVLNYVE